MIFKTHACGRLLKYHCDRVDTFYPNKIVVSDSLEDRIFKKINFSFSKVHDGADPIRTKEQIRHINGVRSTTNSCKEKYTEQRCLRVLFDDAYFWNK